MELIKLSGKAQSNVGVKIFTGMLPSRIAIARLLNSAYHPLPRGFPLRVADKSLWTTSDAVCGREDGGE